jgi:hypothetical protein
MKTNALAALIVLASLAACSGIIQDPIVTLQPATPRPAGTFTALPDTPGAATAEVSTVLPASPLPPDFTPPPTSPFPTLTPIPTLPAGLGPTELKYRVLARFPNLFFCDPDFYPIAREDEGVLARRRFPELQANREAFDAILAHTGLSATVNFTDEQILLIYREHKKLNAVQLALAENGYEFQLLVSDGEPQGAIVQGFIDGAGAITSEEQTAAIVACPICLAAGTRIDTPGGAVDVANLQPGMWVWTVGADGARVAAPILDVVRVEVPSTHQVVHLRLSDGRELWASPGHPTADGRQLGDLRAGDLLDGAAITHLERVPYPGAATYDLLPAGATGVYWADGILVGSTLRP